MGKEKREVVKWCRCVDKPGVDRVCFTLPVIQVCMDCGKRIRQADLRDTQYADSRKQVPDKRSRGNYIDIDKMMESKDFRGVAVKIDNRMCEFEVPDLELEHYVSEYPSDSRVIRTIYGSISEIKLILRPVENSKTEEARILGRLVLTVKQEKDLWKGMKAVKSQLKKDLARNRDK